MFSLIMFDYNYKVLCLVSNLVEDIIAELVLDPSCISNVRDTCYTEEDINHFNLCKSIDEAEEAVYSLPLDPDIFPDGYLDD